MTDSVGVTPSGSGLRPFGAEPQDASQAEPLVPNAAFFYEPTEEEFNENARHRFATFGEFNIDRWPADVLALSMPTKFIPVTDAKAFLNLYDYPGDNSEADRYAKLIDDAIGWDNHFIRLNSRSPKDASFPVPPITVSGKQAMAWILSSERCLDDAVTMWRADQPIFICCRDWVYIPKDSEVRCFAKDGRLIAVSRYDYATESLHLWDGDFIMDHARCFYEERLARHYDTVVFDLALGAETPLLIELNPYGLSDPCCFGSYEAVEAVGGFLASAIEARRAETQGGSVADESATGKAGDAKPGDPQ